MVFHYRASGVLLAEIWGVLRTPVTPWKSALLQQAIRESFERAQRRGGDPYETCCEDILSCAADDAGLTPDARADLKVILRRSGSKGRFVSSLDLWQAQVAAFCLKLEMIGFDIDSELICEAARGELAKEPTPTKIMRPHHIDTIWLEERFKHRVVLRAHHGGKRRKVRTLRTHRGFILQATLGRDLDPVQLDVFGPKYSRVSDWMEGLREDKAWSLELRDVPGYDPGAHRSDRDAPTTFVQDASGG